MDKTSQHHFFHWRKILYLDETFCISFIGSFLHKVDICKKNLFCIDSICNLSMKVCMYTVYIDVYIYVFSESIFLIHKLLMYDCMFINLKT